MKFFAALSLIFVLGLGLRAYHLEQVPAHNETIDEYAWAWSGMTLWQDRVPKAWSYLGAYHAPWQQWRGWGYRIVRPWLDHPPLFSVVMGAWMLAGGYRDMFTVDLRYMRESSLILFVADFWLLWFLLRRFFEPRVVVLGLAFFAVSPLVVINTKLVISENFWVLVYAATHLSLLKFEESGRARHLVGVGLGAVALPLIKVAALGYSLYLLIFAALRRDRLLFLVVGAGGAAGLGLYLLWGYHYDWHLFRAVMAAQSSRFSGFAGLFELMFQLRAVATKFNYYPFYLAIFAVLGDDDERARPFYLQYIVYIACMTFFVDQGQVYGWYLIPVFPVLCMGLSRMVWRMLDGERWILLAWSLVSLPYIGLVATSHNLEHVTLVRYLYLGALLAVLGFYWLVESGRVVRAYRWVAGGLVAAQLIADVQYLLSR